MPWALIVGLILDRAAKGFPWLSELIKRNKPAVVALAEKVKPSAAVMKTANVGFGAAPADLKAMVLAFLTQMQAKSTGFVMKFLIGQLIHLSQTWVDQIWDSLFAAAQSGKDAAVTFGAGPNPNPNPNPNINPNINTGAGAEVVPMSAEAVAFANACESFKV